MRQVAIVWCCLHTCQKLLPTTTLLVQQKNPFIAAKAPHLPSMKCCTTFDFHSFISGLGTCFPSLIVLATCILSFVFHKPCLSLRTCPNTQAAEHDPVIAVGGRHLKTVKPTVLQTPWQHVMKLSEAGPGFGPCTHGSRGCECPTTSMHSIAATQQKNNTFTWAWYCSPGTRFCRVKKVLDFPKTIRKSQANHWSSDILRCVGWECRLRCVSLCQQSWRNLQNPTPLELPRPASAVRQCTNHEPAAQVWAAAPAERHILSSHRS